ncbi:MAG: hypothetical protein U0269_24995 [Polyangiales bacterium]
MQLRSLLLCSGFAFFAACSDSVSPSRDSGPSRSDVVSRDVESLPDSAISLPDSTVSMPDASAMPDSAMSLPDGSMMTMCPLGQTSCGGACVDTLTNSAHCGGCNRPCPVGQGCANGTCTMDCAAPRQRCLVGGAMVCVDVTNDPQHCGGCGDACGAMDTCVARRCVSPPRCTARFNPNNVACGATTTAEWTCVGATSCMADCGGGNVPLNCREGMIETIENLVVNNPGLTCRFTATGPGGTFNTTVSATCSSAPSCLVRITPTTAMCPGMVTGEWTCRGATMCTADCGTGPLPLECPEGTLRSAPLTISAPAGVSCRFTATGPGGTYSTTVSAACIAPPACTVRLSPSSVTCPGSTTGEWTCRGASSCSADCGSGPIALTCPEGALTTAVLPVSAPGTTCRFTATGPGGTYSTTVSATCR